MNKARITGYCLVAVAGLMIFGAAVMRLFRDSVPHIDLSRERYPIMGVDLSAHNGTVDFGRMAESGAGFVFLKASEGRSFKDSMFRHNYNEAKKAGIKVGAYHFFRFDCDGESQGRNFLASVCDSRLDLPMAIDIEEWSNPPGFSTTGIVTNLRRMIFTIEAAGRSVMIYTNKNGYVRFVRGRFDELPLWICSFSDPPVAGGKWTIWQHSHCGRIDGAGDEVDLNVFNGDSIEWKRWLGEIMPSSPHGQ